MASQASTWIVDTGWLAERLGSPDIVVVDGSLHLPTSGRNARAEFLAGHIPGALFFDIEDIADKKNALPHMLPSSVQFASEMKKLGIGDGMRVVAYDSEGLYSAARVWWMFRAMGYQNVAVLNGGLKKWKAEGRPLEEGPAAPREPRHFTPRADMSLVRDKSDVMGLIGSDKVQIVDARAPGRFKGLEPEPRKGLRSGRIPGSKNVHYATLLNADGTLKSPDELRRVFAAAGVDVAKPVVASCGSGVTAGVVAFALAQIGAPDAAVYDGSWTEWGHEDAGTPVEKG